jgi:hypothetical protein
MTPDAYDHKYRYVQWSYVSGVIRIRSRKSCACSAELAPENVQAAGSAGDVHVPQSMHQLNAFIDYLLLERVQKNWTQDPTQESSPVPAPPGVAEAMTEDVKVGGAPLFATPGQMKRAIEAMIDISNTVEDFNSTCTLPVQVIAALTSTGPAQDIYVDRIQAGWNRLASGRLGGKGDRGKADYHVPGTFRNRVVALQSVERDMILSDRSRADQMQRGKSECWTQYHAPRSQKDTRALLGTQFEGASSLYTAAMRAHTMAATTAADIPDVQQFTDEFAALVEHHAAKGLFFL